MQPAEGAEEKSLPHPVEPRATTAMLPPVLVCVSLFQIEVEATWLSVKQSKTVDADPLCWLEFTEDSIITSCKSGTFDHMPGMDEAERY